MKEIKFIDFFVKFIKITIINIPNGRYYKKNKNK